MHSIVAEIITDIAKSEDESERITVKEEIYKDAEIEICEGKTKNNENMQQIILIK